MSQRSALALLKIEEDCRQNSSAEVLIADLLAVQCADVAFEPPRADIHLQITEFD